MENYLMRYTNDIPSPNINQIYSQWTDDSYSVTIGGIPFCNLSSSITQAQDDWNLSGLTVPECPSTAGTDDGTNDDGTNDDGTNDDGTNDYPSNDYPSNDDPSTLNTVVEEQKDDEEIVDDLDLFKVADVTKEERNVVFDLPNDDKEHWQYGALGDVALMTYSVLGKNILSNFLLLPVSSLGSLTDIVANL